jgi:2Fe-2S ferredoxin
LASVTYVSSQGAERTVEVQPGTSIMRAAISNGIKGIFAECGGEMMCATCHVYLDDRYLDQFPPVSDHESEMLDTTASDRQHNSRLSCGLIVTKEHDQLIVYLPESQR